MRKEPLKVTQAQFEGYQKYRNTFSTGDGEWVLEDLEKYCEMECFVPGDLYATLRNAFNRDFLVRIKFMIKQAEGSEIVKEDE